MPAGNDWPWRITSILAGLVSAGAIYTVSHLSDGVSKSQDKVHKLEVRVTSIEANRVRNEDLLKVYKEISELAKRIATMPGVESHEGLRTRIRELEKKRK